MNIKDGEIMDFTKHVAPIPDPKLTSDAPNAPAEAPVAARLESKVDVNQGIKDPPFFAAKPKSPEQIYDAPKPAPVQHLGKYEPLEAPYQIDQQSVNNGINSKLEAIKARLKARQDVLLELDDPTPEVKAQIKALAWAFDQVDKERV